MEFRRPDSLHQASPRPDGSELNLENEDTMASLDLYIETLEADKREEKMWLPPPSPMHSSDSNFDIYSGLDIGSKTSSELYNYNCKPFSYKQHLQNQLMGSLGSHASPQHNDRSHDCHSASPKPSQSDRESDHSDREQDAAGISSRQGPSTAVGASWDVLVNLQPSSSLQGSEFEDGRKVQKKTTEQERTRSSTVDPLTAEKASCGKPGKEAEAVLASSSKDYNDLLEKYRILRGNMLSLLRTAQTELQRKTDAITELREAARSHHKMPGKNHARKVKVTHTSMQTEPPVSLVPSPLAGSSQQVRSKKATMGTDRRVLAEPAPCRDVATQSHWKSAGCRNITVQTEPRPCRNLSVQTDSSVCRNRSIQTEPAIGSNMHCQTEPALNRTVHVQTERAVSSGISVQTEMAGAARDEQSQTDSCVLTSSQSQTETQPAVKPAASSRVFQPTTPDLQLASPPAHSSPRSQSTLSEDELVDVEDTVTAATVFLKTFVAEKGVSSTDSVPELETSEAVEVAPVAPFLETVASEKVDIVMDESVAGRKSPKVKETSKIGTSAASRHADSGQSHSAEDVEASSTFVKISRKRRCSASPSGVTSGKKGCKEKVSSGKKPAACMRSISLDNSLALKVPKASSTAQPLKSYSELCDHEVDDVLPDSKTNTDCKVDTVPPAIRGSADETPGVFSSKGFGPEKDKDGFRGVRSVTPGEVLTIDLSVTDDDSHDADAADSDEEFVPASTSRNLKPEASTTAILQEQHQELGTTDLQDDDPRDKKLKEEVGEEADTDQEPRGKISDNNVSIQWHGGQDETGVVIYDGPENIWDKDTEPSDKLSGVSEQHPDHAARPPQEDVSEEKQQKVFRLPTPLRLTQSSRPCTAYLSPVQAVTPPHPDQARGTGGPFAAVKGDAWRRKLLLWVDYSHKRVSRRQEIDAVFTGQRGPRVFDWVGIPSTKREVCSPKMEDADQFTGLVGLPEQRSAVANENGAEGRVGKAGSSHVMDSDRNQQIPPWTTSESRFSTFSPDQTYEGEIQAGDPPHQEWFECSKGKDQRCHETEQLVEGRPDASRGLSCQKQGKKKKSEKNVSSTERVSEKKDKQKKKKTVKTKKDKCMDGDDENVTGMENVKGTIETEKKVGEERMDKTLTRDDERSKAEDANKLENVVLQKDTDQCEKGTGGNQRRCDEITDLKLMKEEPQTECLAACSINQSVVLPANQAGGDSSSPTSHLLCSTSATGIKAETNSKYESLVCQEGQDREDGDTEFVLSDSDSASIFTDVDDSSPRKRHQEPRLVSEAMEFSASEDDCTQDVALVPEIRSPSAFRALYASQSIRNSEAPTRQSGEEDKPGLGVHEQTGVDSSGKGQFQDKGFEKSEFASAQGLPSKDDDDDDVFSSTPANKHSQLQVTPTKERCTRSESSAVMEMKENGTPETKPLAFRQALLSSPSVIWSPEKTSYNIISTREPVSSRLFHSLAGFSIIGNSHCWDDTSTSHSGSVLPPSLQQKQSAETVSRADDTFVEENSKDGFLAATEHAVSVSRGSEVTSKSRPEPGQNEQSSSSSSGREAESAVDDDEETCVSKEKGVEDDGKAQPEAPGGAQQCSDDAPLFGYPSLTAVRSGPAKLNFRYKRTPNFLVSSSSSTSATSATSLESSSTTSVLSSSSSSTLLADQHHPQLSKHIISATKQTLAETVGEGSNQGSTGFHVDVHNTRKICPRSASSSPLLGHVSGVTPAEDTNKKLDTKERAPNFDADTQKINSPLNDGGVEKTSKDSSQLLVSAVQSTSVDGAEGKISENLASYPPHPATQSKDRDSLVAVASSHSDPDLEEGEILETSSSSDKPEVQQRAPNPVLGITEGTLEEGEIVTRDGFSPAAPAHTDEPPNIPSSSAQTLEPDDGENAQFSDLRELLQHKKDKSLGSLSRNSTSSPDPSRRYRERADPVFQSRKPNNTDSHDPIADSSPSEGERIKKKKTVVERNPSRTGKWSHSGVDSTKTVVERNPSRTGKWSHSGVDSTKKEEEEHKELEILKQKLRAKQDKLRRLIVSQHNAGSLSDSDSDDAGPSLKQYTIPKVGTKTKAADSGAGAAPSKASNSRTKRVKPTSVSLCKDKPPREPPNAPSSQTSQAPSAGPSFKPHQSVSQPEKNVLRPQSKGRNTSPAKGRNTSPAKGRNTSPAKGRNACPAPNQIAECGTAQAPASRSASQGSVQHSDTCTVSKERGHQEGVLSYIASHQKPAVARGARTDRCSAVVVDDDCAMDSDEEIDVVNHSFAELETSESSSELEGCSRTRAFNYFRDPNKVRPQIKELGDDDDDEEKDEEGTDEEHNGDGGSGDQSEDEDQAGGSDGESDDSQQSADTESAQDPQENAEDGGEKGQQFDSIGNDRIKSGHGHGGNVSEKKEKIQIPLETGNKSELTCSSDNGSESDKDPDGGDLEDSDSEGACDSEADEEKPAGDDNECRMEAKLEQAKHADCNSVGEISDDGDAQQTCTQSETHRCKRLPGNSKSTLASSASCSGSASDPANIQLSKESLADCLSLDAFAFGDSHVLLEQSEEECEKSLPPVPRGGTESRKKKRAEQTAASALLQGSTAAKPVSERLLHLTSMTDDDAENAHTSGANQRNSQSRGQPPNSPSSGSENNRPKRSRGRDSPGTSRAKFQRSGSKERKPPRSRSKPGGRDHRDTAYRHQPDPGHRASCCSAKDTDGSTRRKDTDGFTRRKALSDRHGQENAASSSRQKQSTDHQRSQSPGGRGRSGDRSRRRASSSPHRDEDPAESCRCCADRSPRRSPPRGRYKTAQCRDTRRSSSSRSQSRSRSRGPQRFVFGNRHNLRQSRSQSKSPARERMRAHSGDGRGKHHRRPRARTGSRERNVKRHSSHTRRRGPGAHGRSAHEHGFYRESSPSPRSEYRCACDQCLPSHSQSGRYHGVNRRSRSPLCHSACCSNSRADLYWKNRRQNVGTRKTKRGGFRGRR